MVVEQKVVAIGYGAYGGPEDATELMGSLGSDVFRFLGEESRIPRVLVGSGVRQGVVFFELDNFFFNSTTLKPRVLMRTRSRTSSRHMSG